MNPSVGAWARRAALCLAAGLAALALAAPASASKRQETILQEERFIYTPALDNVMRDAKNLGVDRLRLILYWDRVAPDPKNRQRPEFRGGRHPSNPAAYDPERWEQYDRIFESAREHGIALLVTIGIPGPLWAMDRPRGIEGTQQYQDETAKRMEDRWNPDPEDYGDFVEAVGKRYSGSYECPPDALGDCLGRETPPRVRFWSLMNEPNHDIGLGPLSIRDPRDSSKWLVRSPRIYRNLVDRGYQGLVESGHANDTILIGETAPRGPARDSPRPRGPERPIQPLEFIRELYCLKSNRSWYTGEDARLRGCPTSSAGRASFRADHPGLFGDEGWAHHPYSLLTGPRVAESEPDNVTVIDMPRLTRELDLVRDHHGDGTKVPVYVTEYGYQTNPPDPTIAGVPWSTQVAWLSEADYMLYNNPRVASTAQFLLMDDLPQSQFPPNDFRYWGTFQSGLRLENGEPKDSYTYYMKRSIHVIPPRSSTDDDISIYGQLRSVENGQQLRVQVQLKRPGGDYQRIKGPLAVNDRRGFFLDHEITARTGRYRLVWKSPASGRYNLETRSIAVDAD